MDIMVGAHAQDFRFFAFGMWWKSRSPATQAVYLSTEVHSRQRWCRLSASHGPYRAGLNGLVHLRQESSSHVAYFRIDV